MSYGREFNDELGDLREDFTRLRHDAAALIGSLIDASREGTGHVSQRLLHQAENWIEDLPDNLGDWKKRGRERLSDLTDRVGTKPLVGIALAVGAGLFLAALLRKRERSF